MHVYKITNKVNGKVYIGQTIYPPEQRWAQHLSKKSKCSALRGALAKYGSGHFTFEVIDTALNRYDLDAKEAHWIAHFKSDQREHGYNLTSGGRHFRSSEDAIWASYLGRATTDESDRIQRLNRLDRQNHGELSAKTGYLTAPAGSGECAKWYPADHAYNRQETPPLKIIRPASVRPGDLLDNYVRDFGDARPIIDEHWKFEPQVKLVDVIPENFFYWD